MIKGIVEDLCERVLEAQELMLKNGSKANSVILNGNKYCKLMRPGYKPSIFGMAVKFENLKDDMDFIVMREEPKPVTNADRIRSMTDEELAEYIATLHNMSKEWALNWLRQEARDDKP